MIIVDFKKFYVPIREIWFREKEYRRLNNRKILTKYLQSKEVPGERNYFLKKFLTSEISLLSTDNELLRSFKKNLRYDIKKGIDCNFTFNINFKPEKNEIFELTRGFAAFSKEKNINNINYNRLYALADNNNLCISSGLCETTGSTATHVFIVSETKARLLHSFQIFSKMIIQQII